MRGLPSKAVLRVAIDATPLIGPRTGIGQFTAGLVDGLRANGDVDVVPFAMTWRGRESGAKPLPARLAREVWRRFDRPPIEWWTGAVDIVHGTNYVVPPSRRAAAVVSVHDLTAVRFPHLCTADTLQYPALIRRAVTRGAHVHCDSHFVADEVTEWLRCDPALVHVIHPGIPGSAPSGDDTGTHPYDGRPYVLALGTIEPRKDHASLVRAFAAIANHDTDLLLVVAGADGWGPSFASLTASLPDVIRARIVREASVTDARRDALVHHARILAYPSVYEGFGFPPLEAMRMGVPVVATDAGSLPEVLGDGAVLVRVGETEQLAEELLRVHTDEALRCALVERGRRRAETFSWHRCASEMAELYAAITTGVASGTREP